MTTVPAIVEAISGRKLAITWTGMSPGDDGQPVEVSDYENRSGQNTAVTATSALKMQGSNSISGPWVDLVSSGALIVNASKDDVPIELRYMRPAIVGGSSAPVDLVLFCSD